MTPKQALQTAIKIAGSQQAFARALGLKSQGSIQGMLRRGQLPARWVLVVEGLTGVPRTLLRPDLYPVPE
jgi:DNA-binding transcriptional regulator YdaS (Cro superfamily)